MATWSHVNWLPFMLTRVCCNANKHLFQVKARVLSLHPATRNHNTNNRDVDLGVTCDGETIVCFHHAPDIPHELTKPIPNPDTTLDSAETHDLVLKSRLNKDVLKGKKTPTAEELAKMFYTTKHRWYPVGHLSPMSKPVARKNSLRQHEKETSRGTRLKREPILIWATTDNMTITSTKLTSC
ncbi:39S ribosomal protein L42, mitochondrial isoform X2 [Neoarius graeffei]|uniref:39S ribosomal protein L42, mitochondrial isoform X2 n=1 Tax=Neoarius graeffei TaxID=443677 RepID=UPI00298CC086|nr:39S ribosomal protein L42, mitochondrial isoform X2 [Neoarius graeffei]